MTVVDSYLKCMNIKNKQEFKITENAFGQFLLQTEACISIFLQSIHIHACGNMIIFPRSPIQADVYCSHELYL
jgi:hypothetical protein